MGKASMGKKERKAARAEDFQELRFKARRMFWPMYLVMGIISLPLGVIGLVAQTPVAFFLLAGPVFLYFARWFATADLLHLRRDSMVVSFSPMSASKELSYGDIDEVVKKGPTSAILRLRGSEVKLPLAALPAGAAERALAAIQEGRERGWASS